jgi:hypothetical protein
MNIYLNEVLTEKASSKPDKGYIQRLQTFSDKEQELTISVFKDTGRLFPRETISEPFLDAKCTDVMKYIGGYIIQSIKPKGWLIDVNGATLFNKLSEAEEYIYEQFVERELINQ